MKILFISSLLPHPYADHAGAFLSYKVIKHLSQKHDISLISFSRTEKEMRFVRYLREYCKKVEAIIIPQNIHRKLWNRAKLLTFTPLAVSNSYCREMRNRISSIIRGEKYHIVQMDYTPMGQYISEVTDSATLINVPDLISLTAKRFVDNLRFSRKKLEWFIDSVISLNYETRLCAKFDHVLAISPKIKECLLARNPSLNISVIPTGVDIPKIQKPHNTRKGINLIFMGAMWRRENIESVLYFYRNVFGLIRKAVPEVKLHIVGGSPSQEITNLADDSSVKVTGYVEDLSDYYLKCDVSIAPMRIAGGIMCKVLDAMAFGLPVVTTSQGNEGVGAEAGKEIFVEDDPGAFADRTIELLQDGQLRKTISDNALDFIRRNFSWEHTTNKLESLYRKCLL